MALRKQPVFRKTIVPWYDSTLMCLFWDLFCLAVWGYSIIGIGVATVTPGYSRHVWVPLTLLFLSTIATVSLTIRLIKRYLSG